MQKSFQKLGVMIDCSRNAVLTMPAFRQMVDILSSLGYDYIRLYTEDTYEVEGEEAFGYMRGKYTADDIRAMDAYAASKNMSLIPCVQTLAHLGSIFRYAKYSHINDIATGYKLFEFFKKLFHLVSPSFYFPFA